MIQGNDTVVGVRLEGPPPTGWTRDDDATGRVVLRGPRREAGTATVTVTVAAATDEDAEGAAMTKLTALRAERPDAVLAACDIWPHATLGEGRLVQSAHLDGDRPVARDAYLFVVDGTAVTADVDCVLSDLLALEEQVATVVARLRLDEETS